jgi:uncharacterized Zn-finger protein
MSNRDTSQGWNSFVLTVAIDFRPGPLSGAMSVTSIGSNTRALDINFIDLNQQGLLDVNTRWQPTKSGTLEINVILLDSASLRGMISARMLRMTTTNKIFWKCSECNKEYKQKGHLSEHIESQHIQGLNFRCPYSKSYSRCCYIARTRNTIRTHVNNAHRQERDLYKLDLVNLEWFFT